MKGIIFDWDGVITNSMQLQHEYWKILCRKHGKHYPFETLEDVRHGFFEPFPEFYNQLGFNWEKDEHLLAAEFKAFMTSNHIPFFEGMPDMIQELSQTKKLAIASANRTKVINTRLEKGNLRHHFSAIVSSDDVTAHKPDPALLLRCLKKLDLSSNNAVYIGDQHSDIMAAKRANIPSIAVTWGWGFREKLEEQKPDHIVNTPEQLKEILQSLN